MVRRRIEARPPDILAASRRQMFKEWIGLGKQAGTVLLGGQEQANDLPGQLDALQAHPAIPRGSAQMPHLDVRDTDGWAVAGSAHVDESIAVTVDPHPLRLVGKQLGDSSQAAVDEDKGIAAQDQVQDDLLDELERGLLIVGCLIQQLIQRMVLDRSAAVFLGPEELQQHLRQALGVFAGARQDRSDLQHSRARDSAMRTATMPSILLSGRSLPG